MRTIGTVPQVLSATRGEVVAALPRFTKDLTPDQKEATLAAAGFSLAHWTFGLDVSPGQPKRYPLPESAREAGAIIAERASYLVREHSSAQLGSMFQSDVGRAFARETLRAIQEMLDRKARGQ